MKERVRATEARRMVMALLLICCTRSAPPTSTEPPSPPGPPPPLVILPEGQRIEIELAIDPETRARGLMYRESLQPGRGMLFVFPERGIHSFWMKNTLIPLDILWLDEDARILHIESDVPPCQLDPCPSYGPDFEASYVLEIGSGEAARYGLQAGERLELRNLERFPVR